MATLLTAEEVSSKGLLPYKPRTIMRKAQAGELGHVRMGRKVRFRPEDIKAYVAKSATKPDTAKRRIPA